MLTSAQRFTLLFYFVIAVCCCKKSMRLGQICIYQYLTLYVLFLPQLEISACIFLHQSLYFIPWDLIFFRLFGGMFHFHDIEIRERHRSRRHGKEFSCTVVLITNLDLSLDSVPISLYMHQPIQSFTSLCYQQILLSPPKYLKEQT